MNSMPRRTVLWAAVLCSVVVFASPARAAFHFWSISEIYSNSSGTLQFVEFKAELGGQQFLNTFGGQVKFHNVGNTLTNTFTFPSNLPGDTTAKRFILATAGVQAAGGPLPDYIMPNGFMFNAGGSIEFLTSPFSPVGYPALPADGLNSYNLPGGTIAANTPQNFGDIVGQVNGVPEPTTMALVPLAVSLYQGLSRRKRRTVEPV